MKQRPPSLLISPKDSNTFKLKSIDVKPGEALCRTRLFVPKKIWRDENGRSVFTENDFTGSEISGRLENDTFDNVDFVNCRFDEVQISCNFKNCRFFNCSFVKSRIFHSTFLQCLVNECVFEGSELINIDFSNSEVNRCHISKSTFRNVLSLEVRSSTVEEIQLINTSNTGPTPCPQFVECVGSMELMRGSFIGFPDLQFSETSSPDNLLTTTPSLKSLEDQSVVLSGSLMGRNLSYFPHPLSLMDCDLTNTKLMGCIIRSIRGSIIENTDFSNSLVYHLDELRTSAISAVTEGTRDLEITVRAFRDTRKQEKGRRRESRKEDSQGWWTNDRTSSTGMPRGNTTSSMDSALQVSRGSRNSNNKLEVELWDIRLSESFGFIELFKLELLAIIMEFETEMPSVNQLLMADSSTQKQLLDKRTFLLDKVTALFQRLVDKMTPYLQSWEHHDEASKIVDKFGKVCKELLK